MKTLFIILTLATSATILSQTEATINENEQTISWAGKAAVGGYSPEGTLAILSAQIASTETEIIAMNIVVDMRSLDQENTQLKKHLRDRDFFHVKKFPVATFILSEPVTIIEGRANLKGIMTIKGVSQTEIFEATVVHNKEIIEVTFNQKMNRINYGITFNSPSVFKKIKENAIADEFTLKGKLNFKI